MEAQQLQETLQVWEVLNAFSNTERSVSAYENAVREYINLFSVP